MHQRRPTSVPLLVRGRAVLPGAILVILLTGGCSTPPPRRAVVTVTPLPTSPPRPEPGAPSAPPPVLRRTAPAGQADFFSALGNLRGAVFDRQSGRLTILADEALPLPAVAAADWAAILRCAQNGQGPAFSLDPADPHNPHGPKLRCVYIGSSLQGTPLGMAMFTADWEMKLMGVGDIRLPISGFKDLFDLSLAAAHPSDGGGAFMRFWITCAGLETRAADDCFLVDDTHMAVKTEQMYASKNGLQSSGGREDPKAAAFAAFLTEHYDEIAVTVPAFAEVKRMAAVAALAYWLRERHAGIDHKFLAEHAQGGIDTPAMKDAVTRSREDSSVSTAGHVRTTHYRKFTLFGGVDLSAPAPQSTAHTDAEHVQEFMLKRQQTDREQMLQGFHAVAVVAPMIGQEYRQEVRRPRRHEATGGIAATPQGPRARTSV